MRPKRSASNPKTSAAPNLIFDPSGDPTTPGALALSVYVSSDYGIGYIELTADGTVKQINYLS